MHTRGRKGRHTLGPRRHTLFVGVVSLKERAGDTRDTPHATTLLAPNTPKYLARLNQIRHILPAPLNIEFYFRQMQIPEYRYNICTHHPRDV